MATEEACMVRTFSEAIYISDKIEPGGWRHLPDYPWRHLHNFPWTAGGAIYRTVGGAIYRHHHEYVDVELESCTDKKVTAKSKTSGNGVPGWNGVKKGNGVPRGNGGCTSVPDEERPRTAVRAEGRNSRPATATPPRAREATARQHRGQPWSDTETLLRHPETYSASAEANRQSSRGMWRKIDTCEPSVITSHALMCYLELSILSAFVQSRNMWISLYVQIGVPRGNRQSTSDEAPNSPVTGIAWSSTRELTSSLVCLLISSG